MDAYLTYRPLEQDQKDNIATAKDYLEYLKSINFECNEDLKTLGETIAQCFFGGDNWDITTLTLLVANVLFNYEYCNGELDDLSKRVVFEYAKSLIVKDGRFSN